MIIMKTKGIQSAHVFSSNDQVFIKKCNAFSSNGKVIKINEEDWSPINFQWIPIINFK